MILRKIVRKKFVHNIIETVLLFLCGIFNSLNGTANAAREVRIYKINGIVGDAVQLPCDISLIEESSSSKEDSVVLILWYREGLETPIHSIDIRGKNLKRAEQWSDANIFNDRSFFHLEGNPAFLLINNVKESDDAVYRCRIDFKYAQTRNVKVNLTVVVPPQKIIILDENRVPRTTVVGPYTEYADLTLTCQVFGGKPSPTIHWYKNTMLLNSTTTIVVKDGINYAQSIIHLKHLQRSDLHTRLTCKGINNQIKPPIQSVLQIDMNFTPISVQICNKEQPLTAFQKYELRCESVGSRPPAKISWWKDNYHLDKTVENISSDGNITVSILTFIPVKEDKGKYLKCRAENSISANKKILETSWKLQIHYIPETKIMLGTSLKQNLIKEGMDIYFDCIVNAYPPVYKTEWKKNNKLLQHNVSKGIIITDHSLVMQNVTRFNSGNYTCIGYNTEGDGISEFLYLNVKFSPFCKLNQTKIYGIAKNEVVNITCEVEANPVNLIFKWKFNNSLRNDDLPAKQIHISGPTTSFISHIPLQDNDYGTFFCSAVNEIGHQIKPCVFHVITAGKPDSVSNCSINNISLNSFSIYCVEGFNGGLPQTFLIFVDEEEGLRIINMTSIMPSFVVHGLQPGTLYRIFIYSINGKGWSDPFKMEIITIGKQLISHKKNSEEISLGKRQKKYYLAENLNLIIGITVFALSTICVILFIFKLRCFGSSFNVKKQNDDDSNNGDTNPDIIPQPTEEINKQNDHFKRKQHISTIDNKHTAYEQNSLQEDFDSNSKFWTFKSGVVFLQDLCHLDAKTTFIHEDLEHLTSRRMLMRHDWPQDTQNFESDSQIISYLPHQQVQIKIAMSPISIDDSSKNISIPVARTDKQESSV